MKPIYLDPKYWSADAAPSHDFQGVIVTVRHSTDDGPVKQFAPVSHFTLDYDAAGKLAADLQSAVLEHLSRQARGGDHG